MKRWLLVSLLLGSVFTPATVAYAAQAASVGGVSITPGNVPTGATGEVLAYSESLNFAVNTTVTVTATTGSPPVPVVVAPAVASPRTFNLLPPLPTVPTPTNVVMTSGRFGKWPGLMEDITSSSTGTIAPIGTSLGYAMVFVRNDGTSRLQARANVVNNLVGFGRAEDPLSFGPGENLMTDEISDIVLQADPGTMGSGFEADAGTTLPDLADLYTLRIFAPGGLSSASDLSISFTSNPLLGFDDAAIVSALRSEFSVSGSTATLNNPLVLSYTLNASISYDLAHGVGAEAAATIPEPSSLVLLISGCMGLLGYRRRCRRQA